MHKRRRGYTVIEVIVAISLLIIASSGVVALQKVTVQGNGHARELATASQVARTWVERLRADATMWTTSPTNGGISNINKTTWLNQVEVAPLVWFRPTPSAQGSPGADIQGNDVPAASLPNAFFCTHVRLAWMFPNDTIRAEVRVVWSRTTSMLGGFGSLPVCSDNQNIAAFSAVGTPLERYNFAYLTSSVVRNVPQ